MAANLAALRNYFTNTLLIPEAATTALIEEGGLTSFEDCIMRDTNAEKIVKNCRKLYRQPMDEGPGPLPGRGGRGRGRGAGRGGRGAQAAGARITSRDEERFRQLTFYCYHMDRIDREFHAADATLARLRSLWAWHERDKDQAKMDVKDPEELLKTVDARRNIEELEHFLLNKRGVSGTPLAYLIRDRVEPDGNEDQGFGQPSFTKELITRARHGNYADYAIDNNFLWSIIRKLTQGGFAWTWVKDQSRSCDGRRAFMQLKAHYLGDSFTGKIKSEAD